MLESALEGGLEGVLEGGLEGVIMEGELFARVLLLYLLLYVCC